MARRNVIAALVLAAGISGFAAAQDNDGAVPIEDLALVEEHAAFADCQEGASDEKECSVCQERTSGEGETDVADGVLESVSAYHGHYHHHHHHHHHYDPHHHNPHHHHAKDATGSADTLPSPQVELKEAK